MMISETNFSVDVIRSNRRKTASIKIVDGQVQVIVPKRLSQLRVDELIRKKTPWIRGKLRIQSEIQSVKPKEYVSGESFTYLGKNYRLKLSGRGSNDVKLKGGQFVLGVDKSLSDDQKLTFIQEKLVLWYLIHAGEKLKEKTARYSKILGLEPKSLTVKNYKSRWGSCSIHGDVSFNWKIIIAPHHIVDYVVVHELCHMKHHDHSPKFWKCVETVIPDYQECREWLKKNSRVLEI